MAEQRVAHAGKGALAVGHAAQVLQQRPPRLRRQLRGCLAAQPVHGCRHHPRRVGRLARRAAAAAATKLLPRRTPGGAGAAPCHLRVQAPDAAATRGLAPPLLPLLSRVLLLLLLHCGAASTPGRTPTAPSRPRCCCRRRGRGVVVARLKRAARARRVRGKHGVRVPHHARGGRGCSERGVHRVHGRVHRERLRHEAGCVQHGLHERGHELAAEH